MGCSLHFYVCVYFLSDCVSSKNLFCEPVDVLWFMWQDFFSNLHTFFVK